MLPWLSSVASCLNPLWRHRVVVSSDDEEQPFRWYKNLERHSFGEFSCAVAKANDPIEDHSQVEVGHNAIFVGVYDGHGGYDVSHYTRENLFNNLMTRAEYSKNIDEQVISEAVGNTESGIVNLVENNVAENPLIAAAGSCCLMGVIWQGRLYIANLGDSRAVLGRRSGCNRIVALQLNEEHNASRKKIRKHLKLEHANDSQIVALQNGTWRVKGIIQVSKALGDEYLKDPRFPVAREHANGKFFLPHPITRPLVTSDPSITSRILDPNDRFLIFASDGLWEHLTNQQAVDIVLRNPRRGIAKKLLKAALKKAAIKRNMKYRTLLGLEIAGRRNVHDDITVIVVFIDHHLLHQNQSDPVPLLSIKGFVNELVGNIRHNLNGVYLVTFVILGFLARFLIFASDGLWDYLTNQQAEDIVLRNPRQGIAKKLLKAALKKAANKRNMKYRTLLGIQIAGRRNVHDDITVIVVFIDHHLLHQNQSDPVPLLSIKGFVNDVAESTFNRIG
ncbi:hypothetical protein Fmac_029826 [Flemingia macrophylla]|uniref:protein-serine/threonine phosphatase n=1 Tax=Flemingia macrophylla TaxID=520843 RepID=A0ABD1LBG4_9FABA